MGGLDLDMYKIIRSEIDSIRWNVRSSYPTMQTELIENYLAKYINRTAISKSRLKLINHQQEVLILYNDYRNQKANKAAPKKLKSLDPLVAINSIVQHLLPPFFQKCHYYGILSSATYRVIKDRIGKHLLRNLKTIRTVFQILHHLLGLDPAVCEKCKSAQLDKSLVPADKAFIRVLLKSTAGRSPPINSYLNWGP